MAKAHPGFAAVQNKIAGEGYSKDAAGAILASGTRKASPAAKKSNPRLNRVKPAKTAKSSGSSFPQKKSPKFKSMRPNLAGMGSVPPPNC